MRQLIFALAVSSYSLICLANEQDAATLRSLLANYQTLSFSFRQKVMDFRGLVLDEASGRAVLASPNKIKWETLSPYPQLLISDGETTWLYDPDLLQATRRPVSDKPTDAPALLLLSGRETLTSYFEVSLLETYDNRIWFKLLPKDKAANFSHVEIGFASNLLYQLVIEDHSMQRVVFFLDEMRLNPAVSADLFLFTPPEGVEVIDERI